jgi:hypothetical protein
MNSLGAQLAAPLRYIETWLDWLALIPERDSLGDGAGMWSFCVTTLASNQAHLDLVFENYLDIKRSAEWAGSDS